MMSEWHFGKQKAINLYDNLMKIVIGSCMLMYAVSAGANELRVYQANVEQSQWISDGTRLICRLTHPVPIFGKGEFTSRAQHEPNVTFDLLGRYQASVDTPVDLRIEPPSWKPGLPSQKVPIQPQQGEITFLTDVSWKMLTSLEQGNFPSIFFHDASTPDSAIEVGLSSVNFMKSYGEFRDCMANLLDYNFDDIERSDLFFEFDKYSFTKETTRRLDQIRTYLLLDPELEQIWIYGYADSKGGLEYNVKLSEKRANAVRDYFVDVIGVAPDAIRVSAQGETRPFEANVTAEGRSYNRRVTIRLLKSNL